MAAHFASSFCLTTSLSMLSSFSEVFVLAAAFVLSGSGVASALTVFTLITSSLYLADSAEPSVSAPAFCFGSMPVSPGFLSMFLSLRVLSILLFFWLLLFLFPPCILPMSSVWFFSLRLSPDIQSFVVDVTGSSKDLGVTSALTLASAVMMSGLGDDGRVSRNVPRSRAAAAVIPGISHLRNRLVPSTLRLTPSHTLSEGCSW